jgi:terminase small subunit-like protein
MGQSTTPVDGDALEATPMTIDEKLRAPTKRERLARARTKDSLTLKELTFLAAFTNTSNPTTCGNITRSALKAGIGRSPRVAAVEGLKTLRKPRVQAALTKIMTRAGASWEQATQRLWAQALSDIGQVMTWDADTILLRPFEDIPDEARWAIKKISETQTPSGPKREIEMRDPTVAIALLAKIMRKIGPETQVNVNKSQQTDVLVLRKLTDEQLAEYMRMHERLEEMGVIQKALPESTAY